MARITIPVPDKFIFTTEIPIRIDDINQGNHLSHISCIALIHEARTRFLKSFLEAIGTAGFDYILTDLSIVFLRQGHYGQTLRIEIAITDLTDKGFDLIYKVTETKTGLEIARAKTGTIWFDYHQQKVVPIPETVKEKLREFDIY
jgi:acyl-CoA thioester hydrolase